MLDRPGPRALLVVAPHADDEVLGAGGLMLAARRAGWEVSVLLMTVAGFVSRASEKSSTDAERMAEARAACRLLEVTDLRVWEEGARHHLRLDAQPQAALVGVVEEALAALRPAAVAMPSERHYHQDHRAVAAACIAALRPAPAAQVPVVLAYGQAGGDWGAAEGFRPSYFVDLDGLLETKLAAMACYASQIAAFPHSRSAEGLTAWHRHWGAHVGCAYAEPFEVLRYVD